jgi:hypothetical protein
MRVLHGLLVGLVAGAAALPGTAFAAGATVTVLPGTASPGTSVTITANGCGPGVTSATATSAAFPTPVPMSGLGGVLTASATIPAGTAAQGYTITMTCGSLTATTTLWVVAVSAPGAGTADDGQVQASGSPSVAPATQGPATGGGGTAHGSGALVLAAGVAAMTAGLVLAVRRRRT